MKNLFLILLSLSSCIALYGQDEDARWRFSLSGGAGYMLGNTDAAVKQMVDYGVERKDAEKYYSSLKLGLVGGADVHYLFNRYFGAGAKYRLFSSGNSIDGMNVRMQLANGFLAVDNAAFAEHFYVNYVGPSFLFRIGLGDYGEWLFTAETSIGYSHYRNEATVESDARYIPYLLTAGTVGYAEQVGLEYFISPNCAIGVNAGLFYSSFTNMRLTNELGSVVAKNGQSENVSRLEFSVGFRFYI